MRSCTVANGTGSQTFANGSYSTCQTISCDSGYSLSAGACAPITSCQIVTKSCPNNPSFVGTFADTLAAAQTDAATCLQRASYYYTTCGTSDPVTASFLSAGSVTQSATVPIAVSSCGSIFQPGTYQLTSDLNGDDCLILSSGNITLNCANHQIIDNSSGSHYGLYIFNSPNTTVYNCNIRAPNLAVVINNSPEVNFFKNTVGSPNLQSDVRLQVQSSSNVSIYQNTFFAYIVAVSSDQMTISNNVMTSPMAGADNVVSGMIYLQLGSGNSVTHNTINGRGSVVIGDDITAEKLGGADDGILLMDQTGATVDHNVITNVFDSGIEGAGYIKNSTLTNNSVTNASMAAISGWWDDQKTAYTFTLQNSTIANNTGSNMAGLFSFQVAGVAGKFFNTDQSVQAVEPGNSFSGDQLR